MTDEFRVPPQDLEAEQSVLGAMLLSRDAIKTVLKSCRSEDFYRQAHQVIFRAIENLYRSKTEVDATTLAAELRRLGKFETAGGVQGVTVLVERVPTAANAEHYANIVKGKAAARRVITFGNQLMADAYSGNLTPEQMTSQIKKLGRQATEDLAQLSAADDSPAALARRVKAMLEDSWSGRGKRFVKTGFKIFDQRIGGLERKKFHLITGKPGAGKSSLIQQICYQMCFGMQPVGYACLDTDSEEIPLRMCCQMAGVRYQDLFNGNLTILSQHKREEVLSRLEMFGDFPFRIAGEGEIGRSFEGFAAWAYRIVENYQVQAIFIDSAAKFNVRVDRGQTMESGITALINDLNSLAKELDIPIVTIHELNQSDDPRPKGSGTWEYVARYWYNLERDKDDPAVVHLEIRKNNNGPRGFSIHFRNQGEFFKLTEFDAPPQPARNQAEEPDHDRRPAGRP